MIDQFNSLPWHDANLLEINIYRRNPGNNDEIVIKIKWPNGNENEIFFSSCYLLNFQMNFGVIAEESILYAKCLEKNNIISDLKKKWKYFNVDLNGIKCFKIITNSTNSNINIYALYYFIR